MHCEVFFFVYVSLVCVSLVCVSLLQCRKTGQTLSKYYKVYGQETCGQCKTKLVICRSGEISARLTYFCPTCQTNDLSINKQR